MSKKLIYIKSPLDGTIFEVNTDHYFINKGLFQKPIEYIPQPDLFRARLDWNIDGNLSSPFVVLGDSFQDTIQSVEDLSAAFRGLGVIEQWSIRDLAWLASMASRAWSYFVEILKGER